MKQEFNINKGIILGKGTFGEVKRCKSKFNNKYYAIKILEEKIGFIDFKEVEIT